MGGQDWRACGRPIPRGIRPESGQDWQLTERLTKQGRPSAGGVRTSEKHRHNRGPVDDPIEGGRGGSRGPRWLSP